MVEGVPSHIGQNAPAVLVLDLTGTNLFAWNVRAKPCIASHEIDAFRHGDRISAERDSDHPGWFKLVDKSGWVKEKHEDQPVWNLASSLDVDPRDDASIDSDPSRGSDGPQGCAKDFDDDKGSKCAEDMDTSFEDMEDMSPVSASSSGSQSRAAIPDQAMLKALLPIPFAGTCYFLHDEMATQNVNESTSAASTTSRWFTGQCHKIPFEVETVALVSVKHAVAPRWADLCDTDEDDDDVSTATPTSMLQTHDMGKECKLRMDGEQVETQPVNTFLIEEHAAKKSSRSQRRNREMLQKKCKTQFCKYLTENGKCPFEDACWFSHDDIYGDSEPKSLTNAQDDMMISVVDPAVRKPQKQTRNKDLKKKKNKTQMCQYLINDGCCQFGDSCWFAHAAEELRANDII